MINKKVLIMLAVAPLTIGVATVAAFASSRVSKVDAATMPTNTRRVWIINNDNWWVENTFYVEATNNLDETVQSAQITPVLNNGDYYYGLSYADITVANATSAIDVRVRYSGTEMGNYNQTVLLHLPAFGGEDTIWMNSGSTEVDGRQDRNASLGTTNGFSAEQLCGVLSNGGYDTCSTANTNGYNAYPQMKTNFFDKTNVDLTGVIVSGSYSVQDYIDGMNARYTANN